MATLPRYPFGGPADAVKEAAYRQKLLNLANYVISGFDSTPAGLNISLTAGIAFIGGLQVGNGVVVPDPVTLTDNDANVRIYLLRNGTTLAKNSTDPSDPANSVKLYYGTTSGGTATLTDSRSMAPVTLAGFTAGGLLKGLGGLDAGGNRAQNVATPIVGTDGSNKDYTDTAVEGGGKARLVRIIVTSPGTLASGFENGDTQDGTVLATDDHILLTAQASALENGPYKVNASGAPTRVTYFDNSTKANANRGMLFSAQAGTQFQAVFKHTTIATITLGTTPLTFQQVGADEGQVQNLAMRIAHLFGGI